jgi:small subunit ribosomal protein S21
MTNAVVTVYEGESIEKALKCLDKEMAKGGYRRAIKSKSHYEKPSVRRRKKSEFARRAARKRRARAAAMEQQIVEARRTDVTT